MSMSSSPVKRNSMDIIDEYMDNDSEENEEGEEDDQDQIVPQTPSFQIFKKANRLKKKIKAIQIASRMTKAGKKSEEEFKKPSTEVFKPPDCLVAMMSKIQKDPTYHKDNRNEESHKKLNAKIASSLFLDKIDMDDINALVENNHAGNYEVETEAKFDSRSGNLILRTKMKIRDDQTKPNFIPSPGKDGEDNTKFLNMIKKTGGGGRSGSVMLEPLHDRRQSAHSQDPRSSSYSRGNDRKFSNHHVNFEDEIAVDDPHSHSHGKHKDIHRYDVHPHAAPDHHRLLFPHVECLDGTVKAITHDESFKYFGDEGRVAFFEHYRSMCEAASRITATLQQHEGDGGDNSTILTGDFEEDDCTHTDDNTVNTARTAGTVNTLNTAQQRSVVSQRSGHRRDDASVASSTVKVASVMGKLSQEYYTAFESSVGKEAVKRSIDKQIFNHNSFKRYQLRPYVKPKYTALDSGDSTKGSSNLVQLAPLNESTPRAESSMSSRASSRAGSRRSSRRQPRSTRSRGVGGSSGVHGDYPTSTVVYERNLITRGRIVETDYSCGHPTEEADALNAITPPSPRTKYISGCLRESLHPMPNLILRKVFSTTHNLAHYGIGDKMGSVLACCLQDLPYLEALSLADNNLTDVSLKHLIRSITGIKTLQNLDLSRNKIDGESSDELAEYVSQEDCPLIRLTLQSADVDDGEADRFVQCLCSNRKLLELDLSNNLLGTAETASTGDASIVTGGASLAEFIKSESCRLQVLKVSWNSIRLRSAVKLAEAVAFNSTLTYLDLSCNLMGYAAGEALGDAIMENRTLRTLLVANNNFTSTACLSMCVGVVENLAMKQLSLNENPIGKAGASMIMQTSIVLGSRVSLTAASCNTITQDERCWYDPAMPCRDYELYLDQPFHRAVAFHLLQTVATHSTLIFGGDISYEPPSGGKANKLKLVQAISTDREKYFDEEQQHIMKGLRLLLEAASNTALGTRLFYEADADNSGRLDKDELQDVLDKIGFEIDTDRLQDILAVFDVDGAGTIDLAEFQSLLKSQHHEAAARIKEMLQYPILALSTNPTVKYIPPRSGILRCSVVDGFVRKKNFYTITSVDQKYAFQMAKGIGDVLMMTDAVRNSKMRMNEAYSMYKMMYKEIGDKAEVLVKVLPQMMYPHEARQLVSKVTHDERIQLARLKAAFSVAVRPMFGAYNGYYCLDLSKELHRVCFARLLEQSQTINAAKAGHSIISYGRVGDTSQHGNWTSFRNEFWNENAVAITAQLFTPMPQSGILEFDFSGGVRPTGGELRLTDRRMCKVLENLAVLSTEDNADAMHQLHSWKRRAREKSQDGLLHMAMYAMSVEKALEVGRCSDDFYNNLPSRRSINRRANRKEEIKVNFMHMSKTDAVDFAEEMQKLAIQGTERDQEKEEREKQAQGQEVEAGEGAPVAEEEGAGEEGEEEDEVEGSEDEDDWEQEGEGFDLDEEGMEEQVELGEVLPTEEGMPGLLPLSPGAPASGPAADDASVDSASLASAPESDHQLFMRQKRIKEIRHRLHTLLHAKRGVSKFAKASRFVEAIEEAFQQLWILSRHLALLVGLFKKLFGDLSKTKYFGSYCADIVVLLFSRIIDIHNFEIVLEALDARDCACVIGRIGLLNIFNPFKPDVTMELDLRRREERLVAKMIVYLSVDEPGINLNYKRFQWKRELDPIPGWDVTEPWFTEEGLPQHGKFAFTYYSGEGRNRNGCIPNLTLRKALTHMTLIDENEVIDEDAMLPDELVCTAEQHFEDNRQVWLTYLVPPPEGQGRRNHA